MQNIPVTMVREDFHDLPKFAVPSPFSLRWYQPGDEAEWTRIQQQSDPFLTITASAYRQQFGWDEEALSARQAFLCDADGTPIGTNTAWWDDDFRGESWGRVHWVAIVPPMQGRGLAKPLMAAICQRLRELGHTRAYLSTSTGRTAAINLYLKFGFRPALLKPDDRAAWRLVEAAAGRRLVEDP